MRKSLRNSCTSNTYMQTLPANTASKHCQQTLPDLDSNTGPQATCNPSYTNLTFRCGRTFSPFFDDRVLDINRPRAEKLQRRACRPERRAFLGKADVLKPLLRLQNHASNFPSRQDRCCAHLRTCANPVRTLSLCAEVVAIVVAFVASRRMASPHALFGLVTFEHLFLQIHQRQGTC